MLREEQLGCILFPLGDLTKDDVRTIAQEMSLPTAQKPDSQDICFVGATGETYRKLLEENFGDGNIVDSQTGKVLGRHSGYFNYTVGQRGGLGISVGKPIYVTGVEPSTQTVYVGSGDDLLRRQMLVRDVSLVNSLEEESRDMLADVKIRYKSPEAPASIHFLGGEESGASNNGAVAVSQKISTFCLVSFKEPQRAPSPGQFAVFYQGERVLGGGKISRVA